jgi:hypothetical protein
MLAKLSNTEFHEGPFIRSLEFLCADTRYEVNRRILATVRWKQDKKRYQLNNDETNLHHICVVTFNTVSYFFIHFVVSYVRMLHIADYRSVYCRMVDERQETVVP